jgi:aminopeptidase 2
MENWGLITGRTTAYLIDEERSDIAAKKRVAEVASHEVAHQWCERSSASPKTFC